MKKIKITERIKIGASLLLLVCIVLPFSSCSRYLDEDGNSTYISKKPTVKTVTEYEYAWENFNLREYAGWLFLLCFIWPIPILIHRYKSQGKRLKLIFWAFEPLLIVGSSYYVWIMSTILSNPAIGAYLMHLANLSYGTAWVSEGILKIKKRKNITNQSS